METPNQESIDTFMSITGSSGLIAIQRLTEHGGNLNEAVNAHFRGDTNIKHQTDVAAQQENCTLSAPRIGMEEEMIRAATEASKHEAEVSQPVDPQGIGYRVRYARRRRMQNRFNRSAAGPYSRPALHPPSPSLTAQRLIREQQDDEYLASLQADREKELAAREAAMEEERQKERKLEQEQEIERQLTAKEASLPEEPSSDEENAVTLLVRMPDGSRRGRRFLRTDKLQYLFDFMDVGRVVKPNTYRLVRPYPRRAFSDGESNLTMKELGLSSKQEALFLELI